MAIVDSRTIADHYLEWVRREVGALPFTPRLATLLLRPAADAASAQYRDVVLKDARASGFETRSFEALGLDQLRAQIADVNRDRGIHGLVVLYPLRTSARDEDIMDLVVPRKDIEGLHSINLGYLIKYKVFLDEARTLKCVVPATAKAVVKALQWYPGVRISGAFVTLVNNSMRVGKPLGLMLENLGATVVKCYDLTRPEDLEHCVRRSDIVVTAVPDPAFRLDPSWVKPGATVFDVSYQGNIDVRGLEGRAALHTVPENRLGKITRAMMLVNLVYCVKCAS
ncbi:MAG: bifunctional 5,10-methylenetetrahydrofolate dehydrogenase/5,10-methenyltetrahydrofolate cyclohydrolase [Burkholderiales bacterium]